MIYSMTSFARQETQNPWGSAVWELKAVNHRYLEINLKLPDFLSNLEPLIREILRKRLNRGKIEVTLRYKSPQTTSEEISINNTLVQQLISARQQICKLATTTTALDPIDLLRWPGVMQLPELNLDELQPGLMALFEKTLQEFINTRHAEGKLIQDLLLQRLESMQKEILKVRTQLPNILNLQREKITARLDEIKSTLEPNRLEQEMVLFAHKIDVAEELDRLEIHISQFKKSLEQGDAIGKRLDFLLQELNREANTLGSKSVNPETTLAAVELKVLIEQMREQVQNIE